MKKVPLFFVIVCLNIFCNVQAQQPPGLPSKEERMKHVAEKIEKEITLTNSQKEKIKSAYMDFFTKMDELRSKDKNNMPPPPPLPPPGSKEKVDQLSNKRDEQIKQILSAAQYQKYQQLEKTLVPFELAKKLAGQLLVENKCILDLNR